jgi:phosphatidate cytidylyltransferase
MAFDDGWLFLLGMFSTGLFGSWEAVWMARQAGYRPLQPFAFLLALAVLIDATLPSWQKVGLPGAAGLATGDILGPGLGLVVAGSLAAMLVRVNHQGSLIDWALTLALPLYVAGLLQFFAPLRYRTDAGLLTWPALVLLTSWACDSSAYFAGRAFGRVRLAPGISPAKSVEGAAVGLAAATTVGVLFSSVTGLDPHRMAGVGLAVGLGSVTGDLVESLLKRQCGVKDSGVLMPGHGGLLDRMDALIFSAALAHFYLQAVL